MHAHVDMGTIDQQTMCLGKIVFSLCGCVCVRVQCSVLRMILLMMVAICLNGCVVVEQPHSSFFEFYPRFRELVMMIQQCNGAVPWPAASPIPFAISRSCQSKLRKLLVWCTLQPKLGSQAVWNHAVWDTRDFLHPNYSGGDPGGLYLVTSLKNQQLGFLHSI